VVEPCQQGALKHLPGILEIQPTSADILLIFVVVPSELHEGIIALFDAQQIGSLKTLFAPALSGVQVTALWRVLCESAEDWERRHTPEGLWQDG